MHTDAFRNFIYAFEISHFEHFFMFFGGIFVLDIYIKIAADVLKKNFYCLVFVQVWIIGRGFYV